MSIFTALTRMYNETKDWLQVIEDHTKCVTYNRTQWQTTLTISVLFPTNLATTQNSLARKQDINKSCESLALHVDKTLCTVFKTVFHQYH